MKFWIKFQSPLKRFLQPKRPFKLTKGGWVFILYTIGVGAGAINTGNNLLYLIFGLFLGFIMASGVLSDMDLWRIGIDWHFPEAGEAQKPCSIPLLITNKKTWMPSLSITVALEGKLAGEEFNPTLFVPSVLPREQLPREATFVPPRRGYYEFERARLYTSFPFGLLKKQWTLNSSPRHAFGRGPGVEDLDPGQRHAGMTNVGFYIYPTLFPISDADYMAFMTGNEERASSERRGEGSTVSGLREYVSADSAKRIHWKASAKHGEWLVRETDLDEKRSVHLLWPAWTELKSRSAMEIEEFIAFSASLLWGFEQRGQEAGLFIEGETWVSEPLKYLSLIQVADPMAESVAGFLKTTDESRRFDAADPIDAWRAYQQWKKRT